MTWEFEHWHEDKVYLHNDKWKEFKDNIDKFGYKGEKHDWNHQRGFCRLHTPRLLITDLPCPGEINLKHKIESTTHWTMVYESFPAFERTKQDPEGWLPSWNLYAEDNQPVGEELTILTTGNIFFKDILSLYSIPTRSVSRNTFAYFRNQYWLVKEYQEFGIGANPPAKKIKPKKNVVRSIFDPFEESW